MRDGRLETTNGRDSRAESSVSLLESSHGRVSDQLDLDLDLELGGRQQQLPLESARSDEHKSL